MTEATLIILIFVAVVSDLRQGRIPNVLIVAGFSLSLIIAVTAPHEIGVIQAERGATNLTGYVGGIGLGLLCLFPFYLLRAMGAGDVKLMMMVGAFLGPMNTVGAVVLTFAAGGVLAIVMALWQRSFRQLAMNLRFMLMTSAIRAVGGQAPRFEPLAQTAGRMPYAVAIAAGVVLQLILVRSGGWALS